MRLDVGGHRFSTMFDTLVSREPESLLAKMAIAHAEEGEIFIDRDGTVFRYVLNYLR